jgi:hypothetical protein
VLIIVGIGAVAVIALVITMLMRKKAPKA